MRTGEITEDDWAQMYVVCKTCNKYASLLEAGIDLDIETEKCDKCGSVGVVNKDKLT